jgi:hypothetical protein
MAILCIVPTAARANRIARRLCDAQDGLLLGRQATTFGALAAELLAGAGDRRPILDALGERLLAAEAGRKAGGILAELRVGDGLAGALATTLRELRRGEVGAADAQAAAEALGGAARERLERIAAALAHWERRLEALELLDAPAALRAAAAAVRRGARDSGGASPDLLLLDGFVALAPGEWALFEPLAERAGSVRVHLPHFADAPESSGATEPLVRRLEGLGAQAPERRLELQLDRLDRGDRAAGATPADGAEQEAAAAARIAAGWIAEGIAPDDLRVFSPAPGLDAERLARAFADAGVPLALGRPVPLRELPVVRLVREALGAAGGMGRRAAERLLSSPYLALAGAAPRLPDLLDRSGALDGRLRPEESLRRRAGGLEGGAGRERAALGRAAEGLRTLAALLAPLDGEATARRHASRLAAFLDRSGIRRRVLRAERSIAARDQAALGRVADAAESVARALAQLGRAEERLPRAAWADLLGAALDGASIPLSGDPFGGAVELLAVEDAPGEGCRRALLVGCGRRRIPAPPPADPLLRDAEREAVNERLRRRALETGATRRRLAEHALRCAVAAPQEAIHFTWRADEGPPAAVVGAARAEGAGGGSLQTVRERLRGAARRGRRGEASAAAAAGEALEERAASAIERGGIEGRRRAAVQAGAPHPFAGQVSADAIAPALPMEWTPSQLEEQARCPFRLLLRLGAGLPGAEGAGVDIDPRDEGSLLHAALERFVSARVARGAWPPAGDDADREEAAAVAEALFEGFAGAGRTGDPAVWAARRRSVRARLVGWVEAEARDADGLVPRLLEFSFGGVSGRPPLVFGEGEGAVAVRGRIDRVDADARRLLVLDYKDARDDREKRELLEPEAFGVTSFQVPIYLAAAARELPAREQAAATYAFLRDGKRAEPVAGPTAELVGGEAGDRLAGRITGAVAQARAGRFPIASRDCEWCEFGAVCRAQGTAALPNPDRE